MNTQPQITSKSWPKHKLREVVAQSDRYKAHAERLAEAAKLGLERLEWQIAYLNERGKYVAKFMIDAEEKIREALAAWEGAQK